MATLPTEIITEILVRLPVKSLIRFLCVNKLLYSLIKNPNFIKLHLNKTLTSNSEGYLVLLNRFTFIAEFDLENVQIPPIFSVRDPSEYDVNSYLVGSCNGIVCIYHKFQNDVYLYNPLTMSCQKIPGKCIRDRKTLMDDDDDYYNDDDYYCDDHDMLVYGFGYDSVTDDYKVFCYYQKVLRYYGFGFHNVMDDLKVYTEAEVFSVKNKFWKPIEVMCDFHSIEHKRGVYLNNALYYVFYENPDYSNFDLRNRFIAKFDFETDTLLHMDLPNADDDNNDLGYKLSALDGYLCMLVEHFPRVSQDWMVQADFWVMKCMENEAWVKLFSILDPRGIGINFYISVVAFSKDWSRILLVVDRSKLGWYDLDSGLFETITPGGQPCINPDYSSLCYLSGSLVSLVDDKLQLEG